jgi:Tfp pilus assembly protein PilN
MIKINLASKKRAVATSESAKSSGNKTVFTTLTDSFSRMDMERLNNGPIRRLLINGIAAFAAYWLLGSYKEDELKKLDLQLEQITAEQVKIEAEIRKYTNVDEKQKGLKSDEQLIKSKMEAVQALTQNRGVTPKVLMTLSAGIPKEIWLESIRLADSEFKVNGFSYASAGTGYDQITDFMTLLGQSAYLTDVKLVSTEKQVDDTGTEIATFELSAKKK